MTTTVTVTKAGGIWWRDLVSGAERGALLGDRADLPDDVAAALIAEGHVIEGAPPTVRARRCRRGAQPAAGGQDRPLRRRGAAPGSSGGA